MKDYQTEPRVKSLTTSGTVFTSNFHYVYPHCNCVVTNPLRLKRQNEQFEKELQALRANNDELALREDQYREAVQKLHEQNQELEERLTSKAQDSKLYIEETKKQNRKYEDKIKELTTNNNLWNSEKAKRAEEIKRLKTQIKTLMDEAANSKVKDTVSDDEVKQKAETMAQAMAKQIQHQMNQEKSSLLDEIIKLQKELDTSRKEIQAKVAEFENEKIALREKILVETNNEALIEGKIFLLI